MRVWRVMPSFPPLNPRGTTTPHAQRPRGAPSAAFSLCSEVPMLKFSRSRIALLLLISLAAAPLTRAQPLADRLPADAILYVGWAGADKLGPAYAGSNLKGVLDASNLPELFTDMLPKVARRLSLEFQMQDDPTLKEIIPTALSTFSTLWHKPAAIYLGPV